MAMPADASYFRGLRTLLSPPPPAGGAGNENVLPETMKTKLVDWVIQEARWLMLGGLALFLASRHLGGVGLVTGWTAMWLGTCGGSFRQWRLEPGLWMLSGLFLTISLVSFVVLAYGSVSDIVQAHAPSLSDCDLWVAEFFLSLQVLFLASVTRKNRLLRKKPVIPELIDEI